mmetsp:Transcript_21240/g.29768  ORF Transcript_21240/g.29768 Transcript_21240/m.29768 type:complete len:696 (-) Transcript_21240:114-2201(-)
MLSTPGSIRERPAAKLLEASNLNVKSSTPPKGSRFSKAKRKELFSKILKIAFKCILFLLSISFIVRYQFATHRHIGSGVLLLDTVQWSTTENDVLYFDEAAMRNVKATYEGARAHVKWNPSASGKIFPKDNLHQFQAVALMATVDRRPVTARRQVMDDMHNLNDNGEMLGCAIHSSTFVSRLDKIDVYDFGETDKYPAACELCFQFSNKEDMQNFLPHLGYELLHEMQISKETKCFGGKAEVGGRFSKWQKTDERYAGFGYPWKVDCRLPNGIKELTCREITRIADEYRDAGAVQRVYFRTKFSLYGVFAHYNEKEFNVVSEWPWDAVRSHDDDRRKIVKSLSHTWDDSSSAFIPPTPEQMRLLHVEGPGYTRMESVDINLDHGGEQYLASMIENPNSLGGVHFRFESNLVHFIRHAPNSTHMIAVVDSQALQSYQHLKKILSKPISEIYPEHAEAFYENFPTMHERKYISMKKMLIQSGKTVKKIPNLTLSDVLRARGIKIHIVPLTTPSIAFEKSVCGVQYAFTAYLAARFAADYHVMMYIDGDTAIVEKNSQTLHEILYRRFFSSESNRCVGHRFRLIEQYVKPEGQSVDRVLDCTKELVLNHTRWDQMNKECVLKEGHIAVRSDSIYEMSVHHPDSLYDYVPTGVKNCITQGNEETREYFFTKNEVVQVHLRNRLRKDVCVCFGETIKDTQ